MWSIAHARSFIKLRLFSLSVVELDFCVVYLHIYERHQCWMSGRGSATSLGAITLESDIRNIRKADRLGIRATQTHLISCKVPKNMHDGRPCRPTSSSNNSPTAGQKCWMWGNKFYIALHCLGFPSDTDTTNYTGKYRNSFTTAQIMRFNFWTKGKISLNHNTASV